MKETGIIMSGNHPKLILDGTKTMTRRVVKPQPTPSDTHDWYWKPGGMLCSDGYFRERAPYHCPYGQVGDRLRVRESILINGYLDLYYMAGNAPVLNDQPNSWKYRDAEWKGIIPSIHMPNWASRSMLEILEIRAERVQDITEGDAWREGIPSQSIASDRVWRTRVDEFEVLWDSLNAKRGFGWDFNPWVWVIRFKLLKTVA